MGFQNANENEFYGVGNLAIRFWNSFGNFFMECTDSVLLLDDFAHCLKHVHDWVPNFSLQQTNTLVY